MLTKFKKHLFLPVILFTALSCGEEGIDSSAPNINDSNKTVSVVVANIPAGFAGADIYIFTITNKGDFFSVEQSTAEEDTEIKVLPTDGTTPFDIAVYIPTVDDWTTKSPFVAGYYSRITNIIDKDAFLVTSSWESVSSLSAASTTSLARTIIADLSINGSTDPSDVDFQRGEIVTLDASVTDNLKATISNVSFFLDETEIKSYSKMPYVFQFNTVNTPAGKHVLEVKATNGNGHLSSDKVTVFVNEAGTSGPSVDITSIANFDQLARQDVVTIIATVTDADGDLEKVEFKINNTLVFTDTQSPFSFVWDTFDNSVGTVTIEVLGIDKEGNVRSDVVNVTLVAPANYLPRVTFTAPADGATFTAGATATLSVNATDTEGDPIDRVEFYRGTTFIGSDATAPYSFDYNTTGLTPGNYIIEARVFPTASSSPYTTDQITIKIN